MDVRPEERLFFIYDHLVLQDQDDDIAKSILYFDPHFTPDRERCMFVGHIVGVLDCLQTFAGSPVTTFRLRDRNLVIKQVDHYIMGLSGGLDTPASLLHRLLDGLFDIFQFFHGSFSKFHQECLCNGWDFQVMFKAAWDCYLPFLRRYGDSLSAGFQNLPVLTETDCLEFDVHDFCSHLLHAVSDLIPGALCGCVFHKDLLLYTQISNELTLRLSIIRPKQHHLSYKPIDTDSEVPEGIRMMSVFLTNEEYQSIKQTFDAEILKQHKVKSVTLASDHQLKKTSTMGSHDSPPVQKCGSNSASDVGECKQINENLTVDEHLQPVSDVCHESTSPVVQMNASAASSSSQAIPSEHSETEITLTEAQTIENTPVLSSDSTCNDINHLVPVELFVQGNSCTILMLFTECGTIRDFDLIVKLWSRVLEDISVLERKLSEKSDTIVLLRSELYSHLIPANLSYLVHDCSTLKLSGNTMHLLTSDDHEFCQMSLRLYEDLLASPEMVSKTTCRRNTTYGATRDGDKILFYRIPHPQSSSKTEHIHLNQSVIKHLMSTA